MTEMSLAQFDKWISSLDNPGPYGWKPEHNKFGKYFRDGFKKRAKKHVDPTGKAWAPGFSKPYEKIGDMAPMEILDSGFKYRTIRQRIRTVSGKQAARKYRKIYGPPAKPDRKPLVRTSGKNKLRSIWDFLRTPGRSTRTSKTSFSYGYTPGTKWIEKLQFGGAFGRTGKRVPPRVILGITKADIEFIGKTYADGYERRRLKGLR